MAFIWGSKTKKVAKSRLNLHDTILEGKSIGLDPKKGGKKKTQAQKRAQWFGEPRCKVVSKARSNSRIQFASNESKLVPRNLDLAPPSKVGLNFSRAFYISLSVIQFNVGSNFMVCILVCIHSNMGCHFILFYFILPNTGIKLHMSMAECKWMLHIYGMGKEKKTLMFSKVWIKWFGHAMPPQLRVTSGS